jgi:hypothetical protein
VNKLGVPPAIAASTASHAPPVPVYFTLYEHATSVSEPEPNPSAESPGIMFVTLQATLAGVPASTDTVPAANVSVAFDSVALNKALVVPSARTPTAARDVATAKEFVTRRTALIFISGFPFGY